MASPAILCPVSALSSMPSTPTSNFSPRRGPGDTPGSHTAQSRASVQKSLFPTPTASHRPAPPDTGPAGSSLRQHAPPNAQGEASLPSARGDSHLPSSHFLGSIESPINVNNLEHGAAQGISIAPVRSQPPLRRAFKVALHRLEDADSRLGASGPAGRGPASLHSVRAARERQSKPDTHRSS